MGIEMCYMVYMIYLQTSIHYDSHCTQRLVTAPQFSFRSYASIYLPIYLNHNLQVLISFLRNPYDFRCHVNQDVVTRSQLKLEWTKAQHIHITECTIYIIFTITLARRSHRNYKSGKEVMQQSRTTNYHSTPQFVKFQQASELEKSRKDAYWNFRSFYIDYEHLPCHS